jgi:hypothetical protein
VEIQRVYRGLTRRFRRRRMRRFAERLGVDERTTVLDVGGGAFNWQLAPVRPRVTLVNLEPPADAAEGGFDIVVANALALPCADASYDVAFANSVIEHLGSEASQRRFAEELRRVGRALWVQTPARSFPFEPHLLTPFVHYLPRPWQRRLLRRFSVWGLLTRPSQERIDRVVAQTRLLGRRELRALFPDCEILRERFLGLTKSYVAVRRAP